MKVLKAENLSKRYGKKAVVDNVSIEVGEGEIVGLLGPNGAGKTTSFYMITGNIQPTRGKVFLNDADITKKPMYVRARMGIGYLSQEPSIFRKLSVEKNLLAILELMNYSRKERKERMEELLVDLDVVKVRKSRADTLSGGERRRVEIARALVTKPSFLLLDEPFAGIDPIAVEDIQNIVKGLKEKNIGVLITDHNVRETLSITDRAYLLYEGKILTHGTSEFLANDPESRKRYLGEKFIL